MITKQWYCTDCKAKDCYHIDDFYKTASSKQPESLVPILSNELSAIVNEALMTINRTEALALYKQLKNEWLDRDDYHITRPLLDRIYRFAMNMSQTEK